MWAWFQFWVVIGSIVTCCVVVGTAIAKAAMFFAKLDAKASAAYDAARSVREEIEELKVVRDLHAERDALREDAEQAARAQKPN